MVLVFEESRMRGSVLLTPTGHKVAASLYVDLSGTWCGVMYMQEIERETQVHCANYGPNLYGLHMGPGSQTMGSNMGRINCSKFQSHRYQVGLVLY